VRVAIDKASEKKAKVAGLLRAVDRFAAGNVAIGGLLLPMESVMPSLTDQPWQHGFGTAFSELKDRYDNASSRSAPPPTMADGDVAAVVGRLHQLLRSYLVELQNELEIDRADVTSDVAIADGTKSLNVGEGNDKDYVVGHVPYDPETTLVYVQVVIEPDGGGGVSASFFQDRRPPPGSREANDARDREANAALLRQAAEMVLESAEGMLRRPPHLPPE
jgi:hypothetical protein